MWYHYPRRYQKRSPKWQKSYIGPYLIVREIVPDNLVLQKSQRAKPFVVHADKVKRCFGETPTSWLTAPGNDADPQATTTVTVPVEAGPDVENAIPKETVPRRRVRVLDRAPTTSTLPTIDGANEGDGERDAESRPRRTSRHPPRHLNDFVCSQTVRYDYGGVTAEPSSCGGETGFNDQTATRYRLRAERPWSSSK